VALVSIISIIDAFAQTESSVDKKSDFQTYVLSFEYGQFYIPYKITGGNLTQIIPTHGWSINISLETYQDGILTLNIPRNFFDTYESQSKFTILGFQEKKYPSHQNYEEIEYEENSTETNRILTIPISVETEEIEIFAEGIPEHILFEYKKSDYDYLFSPIKQIKNGIASDEIICRDNLELIFKSNDSPACVTPETSLKLVARGWREN
jgi:hypothetical protein